MPTEPHVHYALYAATVMGAVALYLMMPKRSLNLPKLGAIIGAASLGGLWLYFSKALMAGLQIEKSAIVFYYIFSAIAIAAAVRVIVNTRPVYSALWFVMVVLASAGLFLTLSAEFMAIAMIIIYAGAILVTYMFVIMLATSAAEDESPDKRPEYERIAREPLAAVALGFTILAVALNVGFEHEQMVSQVQVLRDRPTDAQIIESTFANRSEHADPELLTNTELVGLDLFQSHPLGLELAGVVLLVALIGAVVIAKTKVDEEEHAAA